PLPHLDPPPNRLLLNGVPYTPQAPFGMDAAHEEYCEAAALSMVEQYYSGDRRPIIPPQEAETRMAQIVNFERLTFPGVLNLSLQEISQISLDLYHRPGHLEPANLPNVERELTAGHLVIIPLMTNGSPGDRKINSAYGAENVYHVMLLIGFDQSAGPLIFTNDAGIRQGHGLAYSWATLNSAIEAMTRTTRDDSGITVPSEQGAQMLVFT
ncbi:MAG: C39 family peptidase, partial [Candidatus Dormibacteraceae bacterium]